MLAIERKRQLNQLTYKMRKNLKLMKSLRNELLVTSETNGISDEVARDIAEYLGREICHIEEQCKRIDKIANSLLEEAIDNA